MLNAIKAAGDMSRLRILFLLSQGELNVSDITQILNQSQPLVSRNLKILSDAGLVNRYREGQWVVYRLAETGSAAALVRAIIAEAPEGDAVLGRDFERAGGLRKARAEEAAKYFEANAQAWDRIRALHIAPERVEEAVLAALGPERIGTLLDLGTGTGRMLELLADRCEHGIGIDSSHEMLVVARDKLAGPDYGHLQVRMGDILALTQDSRSVDLVVLHMVLHYLDDPAAAVAEAARVLRPGGRLLVVDFAPHDHEFLRDYYAHRRLGISADQLEAWSAAAGLSQKLLTELPSAGGEAEKGLSVSLWLAERMPGAEDATTPLTETQDA